jgi:hypothetical protein
MTVRRRCGQRPRDGGEGIVPGEARLVAAVVFVRHEVDEFHLLERHEPVRHPRRDLDPVVRPELARLDQRRLATIEQRPRIDQRHEGPARPDDPAVDLPSMEMEAANDAGPRAREVALDEGGAVAHRGAGVRWIDPADGRRTPEFAEGASLVGMPLDGAEADAGDARPSHRAAAVPRRRSNGT